MKRFLIIIFTLLFLSLGQKNAQANALIKGPVFQYGKSVNLTGNIDGDVFLFAQDATVNATISGDLIIFAGQADINGTIDGDLRSLAGQLDIRALVNDDASLAAGQIRLGADSSIQKTLTAAAGAISLNGQVHDKTWLGGGKISILEKALLGNDVKILYQSTPNIHPQAKISGDLITEHLEPKDSTQPNNFIFRKTKLVKKITTLVILQKLAALSLEILIGVLLITLMPKISKTLTKLSQNQPSQTIGWGFVTIIAVPIISLFLFISLIGIPVAVLVLLLFSFSIYAAQLLASLSLGNNLFKDKKFQKPYHSLALGLVILNLLKLIPVIGWLTYFIFILNSLGTIILFEKAALDKCRK